MSIIALKRRAASTIGVSSAGPDGRFSLQGNHRNPSSVVGDGRGFQYQLELTCTPEDSSLFKRAVMSNAGMLATRFPKRSFTVANRFAADFSHADFMSYNKRMRLAKCPDAEVKALLPRCAPTVAGACRVNGSLDRAWSNAGAAAPNMPGKTGARGYSEWLEQKTACHFVNDTYSLLQRTNATAAADAMATQAVEALGVSTTATAAATTASEAVTVAAEAVTVLAAAVEDAAAAVQEALASVQSVDYFSMDVQEALDMLAAMQDHLVAAENTLASSLASLSTAEAAANDALAAAAAADAAANDAEAAATAARLAAEAAWAFYYNSA